MFLSIFLYQKYPFCPNLCIWLVAMATDRLKLPNIYLNKSPKGQRSLTWVQCAKVKCGHFKRIRSKTTAKRWRHHFPHYKSMGAFRCHENQSFNPICPKTLCSLSPTQMMLPIHIKFDIRSKMWNFRHSRAGNSRMSGLIWPKIELDHAFMPILVTSNFDDDLLAWRQHFPIINLWEIF